VTIDQGSLIETAEELYESAPCGYLSTLPDGTVVRANQTFLTWIGLERQELVGHRCFQDLLSIGGKIFYGLRCSNLDGTQWTLRSWLLRRRDRAVG
jgi:PAS domain-containing protein